MRYLVRPEDLAPPVSDRLEPDPRLPRACVIGAGSSGLAAAKALYEARVPFDCFEQGPVVGGNWVFDNPKGVSACYRHLEINTSCPRMAFSDFPMPDYYPGYARHWEIRDYFERYVDHFNFRHTITFGTKVEHVERRADGTFAVALGDGEVRGYDAVLVCNGHHWDPRWPEPAYPGTFAGEQLHAHDYREPDLLEGRDVVVVGMGNSAMDIAVEASYVARSTTISVRRGQWVLRKTLDGRPVDQTVLPSWLPWRAKQLGYRWLARRSGDPASIGLPRPDHAPGQSHPVQSDRFFDRVADGRIAPAPGIARLAGDRVVFTDGSEAAADLIVWCTGYKVSFPFFDEAFVSAPDNELPLFKRVVHPDVPGLFFIGLLQPLGAVMPLAEAQSAWVAALLAGRYLPPSRATMCRAMLAEHAAMERRFYASKRHTMEVDFDAYLAGLARERRRGEQRAASTGHPLAIAPRASVAARAPVAA
jgi:dimethylaniline monooxygenase (N-oxide forming)